MGIGEQYSAEIRKSLSKTATAEHLTEALCRSGALRAGRVCSVVVTSSLPKLRSHTFRLRLDYEGAAGDAPPSVILKMGHLDSAGRPSYANRHEIAFYRDIASALREPLVRFVLRPLRRRTPARGICSRT